MPLSPRTRLGPYEIVSSIGAGGMGEVYRAHDTKLGRDVAIKVLPDAFAKDVERMARFEREAQVLASLNHPNIATIHGLEESNNIRGLVMELVEGPTLAERIVKGAIPLEEALAIAKQIAEGLEYAHEKGIIHRDLKPANIKLTGADQVKLLDFGLAKALDKPVAAGNPSISPTLTLDSTRAGIILGTAAYMAPEQARGAVMDKRADIWAYGVVLYEMLTGKRPFAGETVSDTLAAVLKSEPEWGAVPAGMRPLVRRCLEKNVRQRLRDIGDARIAVEEQLGGEAGSPGIVAPLARMPVLPWTVAGIAITISLLLGVVLWRATRPTTQPLMWLTVEPGPEFATAGFGEANVILSPDGTRLVYGGRGADGKVRLYTRAIDEGEAAALAGTEGAEAPFFSPDGQFVGFFAEGKLKKISAVGRGLAVLCDAPIGAGGSWGQDGNIIASLNIPGGLSRIPSGGGAVEPLTELRQDATHRFPQALPSAQAVLFTAFRAVGALNEGTIEVQSLRTGERKTLVRGAHHGTYVQSGHLLYVRQKMLYAAPMDLKRLELTGPAVPVVEEVARYSTASAGPDPSRGGILVYVRENLPRDTLVWLDSAGHTQPLRVAPGAYWDIHFSPDGKRLAVSISATGNLDIWVYEWERDALARLTSTPGYDHHSVWTPDGKHIVFTSVRHGGVANLYWMRADGAGETVRLTESKYVQFPYSFSPDGKRLAFDELNPQTNWDLWTLPLEDVESDHPKPGKPEPFLQAPGMQRFPMISPDGRWLAYQSDESGSDEVYVRRFPGPGGKWLVSAGGGHWPIWSSKKQELFYVGSEGIMVANYTANGDMFVAVKPRLWTKVKDLVDYSLAPDGRRFAVVQAGASDREGGAQVTFLMNFFDELRRRAPAAGK